MKIKRILLILIFAIISILALNTNVYATDLDEIVNYVVTVDPRMNDGTLDITYEITWKVLDSTTEGPLEWVKIGTPNGNFDTPTALTKNIKSIRQYNGSYVRIDFTKKYYAGEKITFKYSIHQPYMYKISWGKCKYEFTPAWFTDAKVDNMTIKWNKDQVKKSNTKKSEENYLIWNKTNMGKGEKLTASIKYDKSAFGALDTNKQRTNVKSGNTGNPISGMLTILIIIVILSVVLSCFGGMGRRKLLQTQRLLWWIWSKILWRRMCS